MQWTRREAAGAMAASLLATPKIAFAFNQGAPILPPAALPNRPASPLPPATAASSAPGLPPEADPTKLDTARDPFEHLVAPVMINGQGPFRFMVDTGANMSCVSAALAETLRLPSAPPLRMHSMVAAQAQPTVLIKQLQVGAKVRNDVKVLAPHLSIPTLDGVLAVDWLKGQRLTLDFTGKRLEIGRSSGEMDIPGRVVVRARRRLGQLTIVDADLGDQRISAMIDSGSEASLCNRAVCDLIDKAAARSRVPRPQPQRIEMLSVLGERFYGELRYLPFLRVGGLQLGNVPVVYSEAEVFEVWGFKSTPAVLLGMDLLTEFRAVALDFGRSEVRFDTINV